MATIELADGSTVSGASGGAGLAGTGPLVLLMHGAAMDRTVWSMQTRWLAHRVAPTLAVDLPGHGASAEAELPTVAAYATWAADLVHRLDRPVHLVGHSMGAFVALETATRAPLASLTLVGVAAAMPVHPVLLEAAEANDPLAAQLMSGWAFAPTTRTGPHPSPGGSMVGSTQAMIAQAAPGVLHRDLAMCAAYDTAVATAAEVAVPTTLLLGAADRMTPVAKAAPLAEAIENSRVVTAAGIGHMIQVEAPELTRSVLADTVAGRVAGG